MTSASFLTCIFYTNLAPAIGHGMNLSRRSGMENSRESHEELGLLFVP